jgi:cytochrome P450
MELLFDLRDPSLHADPYPHYHRLRAADPVHHSPFGYWILSRYADVEAVLKDPRGSSDFPNDPTWAKHRGGPDSNIVTSMRDWLIMLDGAAHRRIRVIVGTVFNGRSAQRLRPRIEAAIGQLLDAMGEGEIELVRDLALPLPITVISELLGIPEPDRARCRVWTSQIGHSIDPFITAEMRTAMNEAEAEFHEYLAGQLALRRKNPGDDLLSLLLAGRDGDDRLTDDEIIGNVEMMFIAGHETTVSTVGSGMLALLQHPDQLRYLREHPEAIDGAVDELTRYNAPLQTTTRVVTDDLPVGGKVIPGGAKVMLLLGAANRDPEKYPDPDRLDLTRVGVKPLSFGGGPHYCLGAPLAKLEAGLAFNALLKRYQTIELATEELIWRRHFNLRGLEELWLKALH